MYVDNESSRETDEAVASLLDSIEQLIARNPRLIRDLSDIALQIQKLKQETDLLRMDRNRFRSYVESANDTIATFDLNGILTYTTPNWLRQLGHDPNDILGADIFHKYFHPEDIEPALEFFRSVIKTGMKQTGFEYRILHKDGEWKWHTANLSPIFSVNGRVASVLAIARDINDRKLAELRIKENETRFRLLLDTMLEGVLMVDNDDIVQYVNHSLCRMYGINPDDILGKIGYECLVCEEDQKLIVQKNLSRQQGVSDEYEIRGRKASGEIIWLQISGAPLYNDKGSVIGSVGVFTDITEKKQLREQLLASQKMDAIGKLAGGIAHDFNNLLTVILGYSEEVMDSCSSDNNVRSQMEEILKAGMKAASLTKQLLTFSSRQVIQPCAMNINDVVKNLLKMLTRMLGEDTVIESSFAKDLKQINADTGQIEQLVMNLALNAREAMPKGGILKLSTQNLEIDEPFSSQLSEIPKGEYVMLTVSDTGCGMDLELQNRVFEPFFSTKNKGKGTGLGLSTVYGIVKQTAGHIMLYSEPGSGTVFKVLFPAILNEQVKPQMEHFEIVKGAGEHILVVEDDVALGHLLERIISNMGFSADVYTNAFDALDAYKAGVKPELVITDIVMPGMNGKELVDGIHSIQPQQKVLYMSGFTDCTLSQLGILDAGVPFIQKPFSAKEIIRLISKLLSTASTANGNTPVSIIMLDDDDSIRLLFERQCKKRNYQFHGFSDVYALLADKGKCNVDFLLIDMNLGVIKGKDALKMLRDAGINTPAILLSGAVAPEYMDELKPLGVIKAFEKGFDNAPIYRFIEQYKNGAVTTP